MDGKKLLKRLDQSALLSDKEHFLSEHMSEAASSSFRTSFRLRIIKSMRSQPEKDNNVREQLPEAAKNETLSPVEENQNHEIHAQAQKVENSKVKGRPLTRSKSRSVQQDVAHPHSQ